MTKRAISKRRRATVVASEWHGSKWIRQDKRLAVYLRDGLACCYCGETMENGAILSLDHIVPRSRGGNHEATNVVTACKRCNESRNNRSVNAFAQVVAAYLNHGIDADAIVRHVTNVRRRKLVTYRTEAKELIARRGSYTRALETISKGNNPS